MNKRKCALACLPFLLPYGGWKLAPVIHRASANGPAVDAASVRPIKKG